MAKTRYILQIYLQHALEILFRLIKSKYPSRLDDFSLLDGVQNQGAPILPRISSSSWETREASLTPFSNSQDICIWQSSGVNQVYPANYTPRKWLFPRVGSVTTSTDGLPSLYASIITAIKNILRNRRSR